MKSSQCPIMKHLVSDMDRIGSIMDGMKNSSTRNGLGRMSGRKSTDSITGQLFETIMLDYLKVVSIINSIS